jgi:hypothetical protein
MRLAKLQNPHDFSEGFGVPKRTVASWHNQFRGYTVEVTAVVGYHSITALLQWPAFTPITDDAVNLDAIWEWQIGKDGQSGLARGE